jgi:putative transposase
MKRKASKPRSVEQIIRILRQADGGQTIAEICREYNIAEGTFYRWKKQYGGIQAADAKRLKGLEKENSELKKMRAEAMLYIPVLKEVDAKKRVSQSHKRRAVQHMVQLGLCSKRRACEVVDLATSSY